MTTTIRDINELQDRRIMMEKKLPPFGSVKPKNSAISRGLVMEYSVNMLSAECEPYFFIGKIPVM